MLYTFNFREYRQAKSIDTTGFTTEAIALRKRALDEYLIAEGFPETINSSDSRIYANTLLEAIVSKDICTRYNVKHKETLRLMANCILDNFCQEISSTTIAGKYQLCSVHTAKAYVAFLKNAFLIDILTKHSFKSIERQTNRKCYAIDNAFIPGHDDAPSSDNCGWRLGNVIAIELRRRTSKLLKEVHYMLQSKSFEVDFTISYRGHIEELIQVTYDFTSPSTKLFNREVGGLLKGAAKTR